MVSGSIDVEAEGKVLESGADAFVRKPADMSKLYEVICRVLGILGDRARERPLHIGRAVGGGPDSRTGIPRRVEAVRPRQNCILFGALLSVQYILTICLPK